MRKKIEPRKKFRRICALVVVGMFVVMTLPTSVIAPPGDTPWTGGGNNVDPGDALGTTNPPGQPGPLVFVAGGDGAPYTGIQRMVIDHNTGFVGIALPGDIWEPPVPLNQLDVAGNMAVGEGFAGQIPAPPNGMIIEGWVGIGTPEPMEALDVVGNIHASDALISGNSITIDGTNDKITASSGTINFDNENLVTMGNVGIGTASPAGTLHVDGGQAASDTDGVDITLKAQDGGDGTWMGGNGGNIILLPGKGGEGDPMEEIDGIDGRVGIGTANPVSLLEVEDYTNSPDIRLDATIGGAAYLRFSQNDDQKGFIKMTSGGDLQIDTEAPGEEAITILNSNAYVGIGTHTPTQRLDVDGNVHASGNFISGSTTTYGDGFITLSTGTNLNIDSGTLFIDNVNDRVGIGTTQPSHKLEVAGETYTTILIDATSGPRLKFAVGGSEKWRIYNDPGTNDLRFHNGTFPVISLDRANGNVGIRTTSPGSELSVQGGVSIGDYAYATAAAPSGGMIVKGNVGIGTTSPGRILHIKDTSNPPLKYECTTATGKSGQDLYIPIDVNGTIYYIKLYS